MSDAYEDKLHVESIKKHCHPQSINPQTMIALEVMVGQATEIRDKSLAAKLTQTFLDESYAGLSKRSMDDSYFESEKSFMRALFLETMARAQEYRVDMHSEHNLSRNDRDDKGR